MTSVHPLMGCVGSSSPAVQVDSDSETKSDIYVEKITHISADITEVCQFYVISNCISSQTTLIGRKLWRKEEETVN